MELIQFNLVSQYADFIEFILHYFSVIVYEVI